MWPWNSVSFGLILIQGCLLEGDAKLSLEYILFQQWTIANCNKFCWAKKQGQSNALKFGLKWKEGSIMQTGTAKLCPAWAKQNYWERKEQGSSDYWWKANSLRLCSEEGKQLGHNQELFILVWFWKWKPCYFMLASQQKQKKNKI